MQVRRLLSRVTAVVTAATLFSFAFSSRAGAAGGMPQPPALTARAAVLIDQDTGQVLTGKNPELREEPASTTKILTALVALQHGNLQDTVTVSKAAWGLEGSSAYLEEGEQQPLENLLYAMMLPSGNDAAAAIAEYVAGTIPAFADLMNETAAACGATDSHFVNPHGLPAKEHYTTPLDLARITRVAMQNPEFAKIVATKSFLLPGGHSQRLFYNHNKLLWRYDGATGVKTGYTDEAGHTLVAAAQRGDRRLIAVVMDDQREATWADATKLLDYGFALPAPADLVQAQQPIANLPVTGGGTKSVAVVAAQGLHLYLGSPDQVQRRLTLPAAIAAPVQAGQRLGRVDFVANGQVLGSVDLLAEAAVPAHVATFWGRTGSFLLSAALVTLRVLAWVGLTLLVVLLLLMLWARRRRRRLRRYRGAHPGEYLPLHRVIQRNIGD